jgi:hypothetical protein
MRNTYNLSIALLLLLLTTGCRPVLTVGWGEVAFVVVLVLLLLGPLLFRVARRMAEFQAWRSKSKDEEK